MCVLESSANREERDNQKCTFAPLLVLIVVSGRGLQAGAGVVSLHFSAWLIEVSGWFMRESREQHFFILNLHPERFNYINGKVQTKVTVCFVN